MLQFIAVLHINFGFMVGKQVTVAVEQVGFHLKFEILSFEWR